MKILVFSDTHLTHKFKKDKFEQLYTLLNQDWDEIIINGDFWDSFSTTFDKFIDSEWSKLFPLLKENAVYIYGNHDKKEMSDERRSRFCKYASDNYELSKGNKKYYFTHGHQFFKTADIKYPIFRSKPSNFIVMKTFEIGVALKGREFFNRPFYKKGNKQQQHFKEETLDENTTLVCGHSHHYQVNIEGYLNSGFFDFGITDHLVLEL
jgi:predicted phosphodiesterase